MALKRRPSRDKICILFTKTNTNTDTNTKNKKTTEKQIQATSRGAGQHLQWAFHRPGNLPPPSLTPCYTLSRRVCTLNGMSTKSYTLFIYHTQKVEMYFLVGLLEIVFFYPQVAKCTEGFLRHSLSYITTGLFL